VTNMPFLCIFENRFTMWPST